MTISLSCDMMKDITEERHRENTMVKKFTTTQTIFTGWGALQENSAALSGLGKKPLVVTSAGTWKRMGAQLAEQLSGCFSAYAVCDCINSEPTDVMIAEGLAAYQKRLRLSDRHWRRQSAGCHESHCRRHDQFCTPCILYGKGDQRSTPVYGGDPHHSRNRF